MTDIVQLLERWQLDVGDLRERMYRAPTPRERERWHGLWLLAQGWSATQVAEALEREPHTIGNWLDNFRQGGAQGLVFEQTGGSPPVLNRGQQNQLKSAVQNPPGEAGIELSNWNWKVVRQFLKQSFDLGLSRSSCLNYLHRLGFVLKRPKKRLLKAKDEERKAFVLQYSQIREEAQESGAKIFFVDEAHFRADADLRGKWVLKGEAALVDSASPRWGEKACYYSGVCLETGEVEAMEIAGNSNAETSTAFLQQLIPILFISGRVKGWEVEPKPAGASPNLSAALSVVCQPSVAAAGVLWPTFWPLGKDIPLLQCAGALPQRPFPLDSTPASRPVEIFAQSPAGP